MPTRHRWRFVILLELFATHHRQRFVILVELFATHHAGLFSICVLCAIMMHPVCCKRTPEPLDCLSCAPK